MIINFSYNNYPIVFHGHDGLERNQDYPEDRITRHIYLNKSFYDLEHLEESLKYINKDSVVVDCGANIGNHSIFWSLFSKTVHAIEPLKENYKILCKNIKDNKHGEIIAHQFVLGNKENKYDAQVISDNRSCAQFKENPSGKYTSKRLDELISGKVDFMKIDVEGAEYQVLLGAQHILKEYKPVLFLEMHSLVNSELHTNILNYLTDFGYEIGKSLFVDNVFTKRYKRFYKKNKG